MQVAQQTTCLAASYDLPDGQRVRIASERFLAAEVLFQPGVMGYEAVGLSEAVHDCIAALPIDCRRAMYATVLLGGGTMMLPGLSTRLERDLRELYLERVLQVCARCLCMRSSRGLRVPCSTCHLSL